LPLLATKLPLLSKLLRLVLLTLIIFILSCPAFLSAQDKLKIVCRPGDTIKLMLRKEYNTGSWVFHPATNLKLMRITTSPSQSTAAPNDFGQVQAYFKAHKSGPSKITCEYLSQNYEVLSSKFFFVEISPQNERQTLPNVKIVPPQDSIPRQSNTQQTEGQEPSKKNQRSSTSKNQTTQSKEAQASEKLKQFVGKRPKKAQLFYKMAQKLFKQKEYDQAQAALQKALAQNPDKKTNTRLKLLQIKILEKANKHQEALNTAVKFLDTAPAQTKDRLLWHKAHNEFALKKYQTAILSLQELLTAYPKSRFVPPAKLKLGQIYKEQGQAQKAISLLRQYLKQYPRADQRGTAYYELADIYEMNPQQRNFRLAAFFFKKLINQTPNHPRFKEAQKRFSYLKKNFLNQ
jgi:tetratricopeptide (TPR) repeat protein